MFHKNNLLEKSEKSVKFTAPKTQRAKIFIVKPLIIPCVQTFKGLKINIFAPFGFWRWLKVFLYCMLKKGFGESGFPQKITACHLLFWAGGSRAA
jgi:hypothetical protein